MRRWNVRLLLVLDLVAAAAVVLAVGTAVGLPLAASGRLGPVPFGLLALAGAAGFVAAAAVLLSRAFAAPVERLLAAAERLGDAEGMPLLGPAGEEGAHGLSRAAIAFERLAAALAEERTRLARKVAELERANRELVEARASLLRSERLATVGQLAAGVAHEIGNPLGAITGYAQLARERLAAGAPSEAADFAGRIADEVRRIDRTVRDLLDFARPAAPDPAPIRLQAAIEAALRLARVQERFRRVEVKLELPPGLPDVLGDEHRLAQVFLNLFLNAGDAMGGEGSLQVGAMIEGGAVRVEVADRGPGIPPADLPRIFDPFFTTKEPGRGTGLGLAVCHGILEALGGEITAANGPEGGAVFRLRLRAARPRGTEPTC